MNLIKRDCGIEIKLVPYGGGWTDVYLNIGNDELYFIISGVMGRQFSDLMRVLYFMYPEQSDPANADEIIESKPYLVDMSTGKTKLIDRDEIKPGSVIRDVPWKAELEWDEEGAYSLWKLEREPTEDIDFILKLNIEISRDETKKYSYEVRYKDFCYAVAKACTEALKEYGFYGYQYSVHSDDMNIRYLLFLKAIALDCHEARNLVSREKGKGEVSSFEGEMELLLFDM
jgi:hypothetical protein